MQSCSKPHSTGTRGTSRELVADAFGVGERTSLRVGSAFLDVYRHKRLWRQTVSGGSKWIFFNLETVGAGGDVCSNLAGGRTSGQRW